MESPDPPSPVGPNAGDRAKLIDLAANSVKWSFLYNALPRLLTPLSTMILAALLMPADFGLVAISTSIIALARVVVDLGMGQALIQRETLVDEAFSTTLWVHLLISGALCIGLGLFAPNLAAAYKNEAVAGVVRVAALTLPLVAIGNIPVGLLRRRLQFRHLFWVNSSSLIISSVASVVLALLGAGVWALIWGPLVGAAASAGLGWKLCGWRPMFVFHGPVLRSMLRFSSWVLAASFMNWLFSYAPNAIGGLYLSADGLGVFSLGFTAAVLIPTFLVSALNDVAYPAFCTMQGDPRGIGTDLLKVQAMAGAVIFPVTFGLSAIAPTMVQLLYGSKWAGLGTVISILVIMPGMGYIWSLNEAAYQATGRPDLWAKVSGVALLGVLPLLWLTAAHGLKAFTLGRFAGAWILPLGHIYLAARVLKVGFRAQFRAIRPSLMISLGMFAGLLLLIHLGNPFVGILGWIKLVAIVVLGGLSYLLLVRILERDLWNEFLFSLRRVFS